MEKELEKDLEKEMDVEKEQDVSKKEKKSKHKEQIEKLEEEIKVLRDKVLRNAAELENFKKRTNQERIQDRKYASKNLISDILNPLDQLNKVVNMQTDSDLLKNFLIGFKMINDQLYNVLIQDGLKEINALNQPFDPNYHYAIEKVSDKEKPNGINIEVIQKGYTYKDQLLRPAMVKINEWSEENGKDE
ncbi:MAG: nucleotide exchange factor GrpE [Tenericutes bacterium HGW-Tenericutes-6]|jgi:molecular chaperone GrpE|nr:MAG: nucleotide exchange factor GrpE [Tenericutes bacterium HGW-Tenericutes-6]